MNWLYNIRQFTVVCTYGTSITNMKAVLIIQLDDSRSILSFDYFVSTESRSYPWFIFLE